MRQCDPEAGGRAVVEDVERVGLQFDDLREAADDLRQRVEGVGKGGARLDLGQAESRQVGGDEVEAVREQRNQVAEHVAGRGEAVQQQERRLRRVAGLPVENLEAVDVDGAVGGLSHRSPSGAGDAARAARRR
jgi:hypothetical protein